MSTRWAKCSVPDSVGRQANSRAALPSFFCFSVGLHSNTPCCPASAAFGALTHPGQPPCARFETTQLRQPCAPSDPDRATPPLFFKAKPATARALLFSCPSLRVCADAPVHFFAQAAQVFLFFPTSALRRPSSGRTNGRFSKKPPDNSEKRGAIGENTEAFPCLLRSFPPFPTRMRGASSVFTELSDDGKHRVPILCINSAAFSLFPSVGKIWAGVFHSHSYILSHQFHNKAFSTTNISQRSRNSKSRIPTCSDCPRTIMYLISHFKNFSL